VDIGTSVKPFEKDKNVMAYELADYVNEQTGLRGQPSVIGGTLELVKALIDNGYPDLDEKDLHPRDNNRQGELDGTLQMSLPAIPKRLRSFIVQDSYYTPDYRIAYDLLAQWNGARLNNVFCGGLIPLKGGRGL
jgi:hypothetical protein